MNNQVMRSFAELSVISDLHLGGLPGFQIFNQGARLAKTIEGLAARVSTPAALVLNGDVFDFLAEEPVAPTGLDPAGILAKLERIVTKDPQFSPVFEALRAFLGREDHYLVLVLGNHDVELALPHVRQWLGEWLTANSAASAVGRLIWSTDGSGFPCQVGSRRVLCLHGNEVDPWNVVDHRALLNVIRAINRAQPVPEWEPNAGTRLVVEVMNKIKRKHPIIDLLKPETRAALPVVVAIDPSSLGMVGRVLRLSAKKTRDGLRMTAGFLGGEPTAEAERLTESEALEDVLGDLVARQPNSTFEQRALRIQERIQNGQPAIPSTGADQYLGLASWFRDTARPESVRWALGRWLKNDKTFELDDADAQFNALDGAVGGEIDYLIAGHTHLRRALPRSSGRSFYFNTGTWIRLVQLPAAVLSDASAFSDAFTLLSSQDMAGLDAAQIGGVPLVRVFPTVATVGVDGAGAVSGALFDADSDGRLHEVAQSRFPR